jgi:HK97 family phage portal protein
MRIFGHEWTFRKNRNIKNFLEMEIDTDEEDLTLFLNAYAVYVVTSLISAIVSNSEFKVYMKDDKGDIVETRGRMWYKLNMKPNENQRGTAFIQEIVRKLLFGEVLVVEVNEDFFVADGYNVEEKTITGNKFTEVKKDNYTFRDKFKAGEVVYIKYGNDKAKFLLAGINDMYDELTNAAKDKYKRSAEEKGILKISQAERNKPDFEEKMGKIINDRFQKYFSRGNHVLPLFEGYEYKSETAESTKKYSNEVTDMKELVGEALARAAQAYKVPVGLIRGDVAGIKDAYTMLLTNCIDPIAAMLSEGFTTAVFSEEEIIDGCEIVADTSNLKHVDIFDMAGSIDKLIASGFLSIDEVRLASGLKPLNEEWSKAHYMTLNYTTAQASVEAGNEVTGADNGEGSEEE